MQCSRYPNYPAIHHSKINQIQETISVQVKQSLPAVALPRADRSKIIKCGREANFTE